MKRSLLVLLCLIALNGWAQKSQIESAALYFNNLEMEDAKKAIDAAAEHPDTKDNVKMLYYRALIYDTIATTERFKSIDIDAAEKWALAAKRGLELDKKEIYKEVLEYIIVNAAFACYGEAYKCSERGDYKKTQSYYQLVIDLLPFDKNGDMRKNNLTEKSIVYNQFYFAGKEKNVADQKKYLTKLIELNYQDPIIFAYLTNIYLTEGDTATALKYLDQGRTLYPEKKDLIAQEINIYIAQGKMDVLLKKVELANEQKPDDPDLIYTRGNLYDNAGNGFGSQAKKIRDEANNLTKKAKGEKNPATKKQLEADAKAANAQANELNTKYMEYARKAEADYFKALELNPDMIDAYYNLGALTNNKTVEIAARINAIDAKTQIEYDKKLALLKKVQDSIFTVAAGYFKKVEEIALGKGENNADEKRLKYGYLKDAYLSLQQIYAGMRDEKTSTEYRKKREEARAKMESAK